jgi:hypothetical protein
VRKITKNSTTLQFCEYICRQSAENLRFLRFLQLESHEKH